MIDRIFINKKYKPLIDSWSDDKNILDFKLIENIEKFALAAAVGMDNPKSIQGPKEGYVRLQSIPTDYKAILSSILLGKAKDEEIDSFANEEACYEEAEKCVENGITLLKEKFEDAKYDEDLLYKKLMYEIDSLYETNVKPYLDKDIVK